MNPVIEKKVNGVDLALIQNTVNAIDETPDLARFTFRLHNKWKKGGHNRSKVKGFYGAGQENYHLQDFELESDEPTALAGEDLAANPVEHLLNALAACVTTSLVYHAAVRGIVIDELESDLEGDLDLRGFLGLSNEVRSGYENIRIKYKVKTDNVNIEKLKELSSFSPVLDVVSNGTKVDISIERK
ncbi:MAG: OsmC family protein [Nitrospirota bacterium]|nr:OsmC family protein [Nitrospirota bacterium]